MERNYAEDQANEVEALESIYCNDIEGEVSYQLLCFVNLNVMAIVCPFKH